MLLPNSISCLHSSLHSSLYHVPHPADTVAQQDRMPGRMVLTRSGDSTTHRIMYDTQQLSIDGATPRAYSVAGALVTLDGVQRAVCVVARGNQTMCVCVYVT